MKQPIKNSLFQTSQLTILFSYTFFSVILIAESILMEWEIWPLIPITVGVVFSWILHLQQRLSENSRIWIYSAFMMFNYSFYASHETSVFDAVAVMSVLILLCTLSCLQSLITSLQLLYYIMLIYGLLSMWRSSVDFDSLLITRSLLHFSVITAISGISRATIKRWLQVLNASHEEIEKLTDATDRLNGFLTNVSHETRTPINAIIGLTGISIDEEEDEDKRANLISVRDAGKRVSEQISDILDFTEIDRKKLTNNYEDYMLSSLLNDLVEEIRPFKPNELELVIDVDAAIPSVMNTDVSKLRKILRHLILNGIKYTIEGGIYVRLYAIPKPYGVNLVIKVTDTGIGMTAEEQERVFERYYQADSGKSRRGGGLGLGLTIVSGFTTSLGGFMTVTSTPNVGTMVSVSIPQKVIEPSSCMSIANPEKLCLGAFLHLDKYANPNVREYYNGMIHNIVKGFGVQMHRVDNAANLKKLLASVTLTHLFVSEEEYEAAQELIESVASKMIVVVVANRDYKLPAGSRARIMPKPFYCFPVAAILNTEYSTANVEEVLSFPNVRALVVDDEPMNLIVAQNILKRYGIIVKTVNSGIEAVDICKEFDFDIIFMDHMMPGMDGIEAMKRIRAGNAKEKYSVPIVALTANAVSTARETFMSVGFDGFVSKPIELNELERVMRRLLAKFAVTSQRYTDKQMTEPEPGPSFAPELPEPPLPLLKQLDNCGLDTTEALHYCAEDEEFYLTLLEQFIEEFNEKAEKMEVFLKENDLRNYEIVIHAMKNTLKLIGSESLSERAKELEFAAKDENSALIADKHEPLMEDCSALTETIKRICGKEAASQSPASDDVIEFEPDHSDDDVIDSIPENADDDVIEFIPEESDDGVIEFIPDDGEVS